MSIILVLIPLSLILLGVAIWAFFWAAGSGQFDDLDSPAYQILMEDKKAPPAEPRDEGERPEDERR